MLRYSKFKSKNKNQTHQKKHLGKSGTTLNWPGHPKSWVLSWVARHNELQLALRVALDRKPRFLGSSRELNPIFLQKPQF